MRMQAALDLYLMEMRQIEDRCSYPSIPIPSAGPSSDGDAYRCATVCHHYPQLHIARSAGESNCRASQTGRGKGKAEGDKVISNNSGSTSTSKGPDGYSKHLNDSQRDFGDQPYRLTCAQLDEHIGRKGGPADHFEHPLLIARSGLKLLHPSDCGQLLVDWNHHHSRSYHDPLEEEEGGHCICCGTTAALREELEDNDSSVCDECISQSQACQAGTVLSDPKTLRDILGMARGVLSLTPNAVNLSCSSYLHRFLWFGNTPPFNKLRFLSVGPFPPSLEDRPGFNRTSFTNVEKLRICPNPVERWASTADAGSDDPLPALKNLQWDYGGQYDEQR